MWTAQWIVGRLVLTVAVLLFIQGTIQELKLTNEPNLAAVQCEDILPVKLSTFFSWFLFFVFVYLFYFFSWRIMFQSSDVLFFLSVQIPRPFHFFFPSRLCMQMMFTFACCWQENVEIVIMSIAVIISQHVGRDDQNRSRESDKIRIENGRLIGWNDYILYSKGERESLLMTLLCMSILVVSLVTCQFFFPFCPVSFIFFLVTIVEWLIVLIEWFNSQGSH